MKKIILAVAVLIVAVLVGYSGTTMMLNSDRFLAKPDANGAAYGITKVFEFKKEWDAEKINSFGDCSAQVSRFRGAEDFAKRAADNLKNTKSKPGTPAYKKLEAEKKAGDKAVADAFKALEACVEKQSKQ